MTAAVHPGDARTDGVPRNPFASRTAAVVDDLDQLRPHDVGQLRLPLHLDGSAPATWELTRPWARQDIAETVLTEAADPNDVLRYVDRDTLLGHWADLALPRRIRDAWEQAHPALTHAPHQAPGPLPVSGPAPAPAA